MTLEVKYEMSGFKKGDMVISNQAAKGHQTAYEIESFFCWDDRVEVHLKDNKYRWPISCLEHYNFKNNGRVGY